MKTDKVTSRFGSKLFTIVRSVDFIISISATIVSALVLPNNLGNQIMEDLLSSSISIQSILFSIQLAAFALVVSFVDHEVLRVLQQKKDLYEELVWHFKVTSYSLFVGLLSSIISFSIVVTSKCTTPNYVAAILAGLTLYGILASALSMRQLFNVASVRGQFFKGKTVTQKGIDALEEFLDSEKADSD